MFQLSSISSIGGNNKRDVIDDDLVCIGNSVFCVMRFGFWPRRRYLGGFNVKEGSWKVFPGSLPVRDRGKDSLIVTFDDKLILETKIEYFNEIGCLLWVSEFWRFDFGKMEWVVFEDQEVKKHAVFCSDGRFWFTLPGVRDLEGCGGLVHCLKFDPIRMTNQFWIQPSFKRIWSWRR